MLSDDVQQLTVDHFLILFSLLADCVILLFAGENILIRCISMATSAMTLAFEILIIEMVWQIHLAEVQSGLGRDHEFRTNAAQRAVVHLQRARHQNEATFQLLQEHNSFASVAPGQNNHHRARAKVFTKFVFVKAKRQLILGLHFTLLLFAVQTPGNAMLHYRALAPVFISSNFFSGYTQQCFSIAA